MPLTVDCPHCSGPLEVPEELSGREFACPLCGGTVAPVAPSESAGGPLDFAAAGEQPAARRKAPYDAEASSERVGQLLPEWQRAWRGLNAARRATLVFIPVLAVRVLATTIGPRFFTQLADVLPILALGLTTLELVGVLWHIWGQGRCTALPRVAGGASARMSYRFAIGVFVGMLTVVILTESLPLDSDVGAIVVGLLAVLLSVLVLGSFWYWLTFLRQLGDRLGARELAARGRGFAAWFWMAFWAQLVLALLELAARKELGRSGPCFEFVAGAITVATLANYAIVLRTARAAVARRAPLRPLAVG